MSFKSFIAVILFYSFAMLLTFFMGTPNGKQYAFESIFFLVFSFIICLVFCTAEFKNE